MNNTVERHRQRSCILIKFELTAIGSFPPIANNNTQTGAGFGIVAHSNTQALLQTGATVTCSLDASLDEESTFMLTAVLIVSVRDNY